MSLSRVNLDCDNGGDCDNGPRASFTSFVASFVASFVDFEASSEPEEESESYLDSIYDELPRVNLYVYVDCLLEFGRLKRVGEVDSLSSLGKLEQKQTNRLQIGHYTRYGRGHVTI